VIDCLVGREMSKADLLEFERSFMPFGPFHQEWLRERAPEKVRRMLQLAAERPYLQGAQQSFPVPMVLGGGTTANLKAAINTTVTETQLWDPGIHAPIPALDMVPGKVYTVTFGGICGTTATPTVIFTTRIGTNNSTPPTGTSLGASPTVTLGTITAPQAFMGQATYVVRSIGVAAAGATMTGNGIVWMPAAAAATATPHILFGGITIPTTIDHTIAQGIGVSITWGASSASNTITTQYVFAQSQN
jgi:hypothetical protein